MIELELRSLKSSNFPVKKEHPRDQPWSMSSQPENIQDVKTYVGDFYDKLFG